MTILMPEMLGQPKRIKTIKLHLEYVQSAEEHWFGVQADSEVSTAVQTIRHVNLQKNDTGVLLYQNKTLSLLPETTNNLNTDDYEKDYFILANVYCCNISRRTEKKRC